MRIKILDRLGTNWILGKVSLLEYLGSMTKDSFNYVIQRGIVSNKYLDSILEAVNSSSPLPPISLIANGDVASNATDVEIMDFNILDGLQRTYRLWAYLRLVSLSSDFPDEDYRKISDRLRKEEPSFSKALSPRQVRMLFKDTSPVNVKNLRHKFSNYFVYVYLWLNLPEKDAIKKMLVLNAGQKRMPIQNQYELMYLHTFEKISFESDDIELLRTKDEESTRIKKGERQVGQYIVPSLIIGLQSFVAGKPVRLSDDLLYSTNNDFSEDYISENGIDLFFDEQFIKSFVKNLHGIDVAVCQNDEEAVRWFSKDTFISGLMGGIGRYLREQFPDDVNFAANANNYLANMIGLVFREGVFCLQDYDTEYANLSSVRINIGTIVRKAISEYTYTLVAGTKRASWHDAFALATEKSKQ